MADNDIVQQQTLRLRQQAVPPSTPIQTESPSASPPPPQSPPPPIPKVPPVTTQQPVKGHNGLKRVLLGIGIIIIATVLLILFLPKGKQEQVTLTWWGLWEDSRTVEPIIAEFERQHPLIQVEYSKQDPKQYRERLTTRTGLGKGPDIFRYHNTWYPMLSDILLPLPTDVITQDEFKKQYYPVMQSDLIHNGGIYGIPLGADTLSLFVNTDLLESAGEQVPTTWEDFVSVSKKLTVKEEDGTIRTAGAALGTYGNITHAPDIVSLLFVQQGVDINTFGTAPQDEGDALDFYVSFATGDQNTWDSKLDRSMLLFSQGKVAFYFGYSWDIFTIQKNNKDLKFEVHPVPSLFDRSMTIASYWVEGVSNKSLHQQEAMIFMKYLSQKETAQKLYTEEAKTRSFGEPYARVDLADTLKDNKLLYPFVSQLKNARSSIFVSDTGDGSGGINSVSNTYLQNAINGIITDGSSTKTVVETLDQGIAQVFAQYGIQ